MICFNPLNWKWALNRCTPFNVLESTDLIPLSSRAYMPCALYIFSICVQLFFVRSFVLASRSRDHLRCVSKKISSVSNDEAHYVRRECASMFLKFSTDGSHTETSNNVCWWFWISFFTATFFRIFIFFSHRLLFLNNSWFQLPHKNIWNNLYFCSPQFCVQCRWQHFAFILRTFECIQNLK